MSFFGHWLCLCCKTELLRLMVGSPVRLGEDPARTAGMKWPKGYSILYNIMLRCKTEGSFSKVAVAWTMTGYQSAGGKCLCMTIFFPHPFPSPLPLIIKLSLSQPVNFFPLTFALWFSLPYCCWEWLSNWMGACLSIEVHLPHTSFFFLCKGFLREIL